HSCSKKPAHAIQLVHTDESGQLQLNESAVQTCFLDGKISNYPVCLICVIGEKRRGKSFLMNYILRALSCQEQGQPLSLGADDDRISGFEWRDGADSTTKGIWIWSKPFILDNNGEKMAVFVLDTEGSLDIQSSRDICLKLSALSMILSSYLIFNVSSNLKTTDMDYLEMYLEVAENVGKSFDLQALQHLNILIRDWHNFKRCGKEDAQEYLIHETEKLQKDPRFRLVSETLGGPLADCSLLPHPGRLLLVDSQGKLSDMEADFRNHLTTYIFTLVGDLWPYRKTNRQGEIVTCTELASLLKRGVNILQSIQYQLASPLQMLFTFENHKNMEKLKTQFQKYIRRMSNEADSLRRGWNVSPFQMQTSIKYMATKFLRDFKQSLQGGDAQEKERLVQELESFLLKQQQKFCKDYSKSKEVESLILEQCLSPSKMETSINNMANKFLCDFQQSLQGDDTQGKKWLENDLECNLLKQQQQFCKDYSKRFFGFQNHKRMENIKEKFQTQLTLKSKEVESLIMEQCLSPSIMDSSIKDMANKFLCDFKQSIQGDDTQRLGNELETNLLEQQQKFCKDYSKRFYEFQNHKNMENIQEQFQTQLTLKSKDVESLITEHSLSPSIMDSSIKDMANKFLCDFKQSLQGDDTQGKKGLGHELETNLLEQQQKFCKDYSKRFYRFQNHQSMKNIKETFHTQITQKSKEVESLITEQSLSPSRMEASIKDMSNKFLCDFKQSLQGHDSQGKKWLKNKLAFYLLKQQQKFCTDYSQKFYEFHNQKRMEATKQLQTEIKIKEYEKFSLVRQDRHPLRIQKELRNEVNKLLDNYEGSLKGIDDKQELLREMESDLSQEIEKFCNMYKKIFDAWKRMEDTKKQLKKLLNQIREESSSSLWNLMNTPSVMQSKIKEPINKHLVDFINSHKDMDSEDQKALMEELISYLMEIEKEFHKEYSSDYRSTMEWIKNVGSVGLWGLFAFKFILKNKAVAAAVTSGGVVLPGVVGVVVVAGTILMLRRMYENKSPQ
ncbi:uncharacterized protein LOC108703878, partial [Xenopus laevis]|uniref:Uncharacterized protein LOC108703878 n=1 Tax=Xenopus laevis TaxID=8355 RepID=A0A8J1LTR4_XENLA